MKRKIYEDILKWKNNSAGRTALLIDGARPVGKSYVAKQFAIAEYKSYILIDFSKAPKKVIKLFFGCTDDTDAFFKSLSDFYKTKLFERETLIILDKVQLCPCARSAINHLVADGRYDYIETGTLIPDKKSGKDILPVEEYLKMYPMDFEEFLWAMGEDDLMPVIRTSYEKKQPLRRELHQRAMDYFRRYMIVGGMLQAVGKYAETFNFDSVDRIKREILELYRSDIAKCAGRNRIRTEQVFENIPSQLQKNNKKFKLSLLKEKARLRDYEDAFLRLSDAMIACICCNSTVSDAGLSLNGDRQTFKCYMGDTGLLISHAFDENEIKRREIYKRLMSEKPDVGKGMIVENIVAQMLISGGHELCYYFNGADSDAAERMNIDFLIADKKISGCNNISPIEVKSGRNYTLTSLLKFREKFAEQTGTPYVLHSDNLKEENGIVYLPLYMTPLL